MISIRVGSLEEIMEDVKNILRGQPIFQQFYGEVRVYTYFNSFRGGGIFKCRQLWGGVYSGKYMLCGTAECAHNMDYIKYTQMI